MPDPALTIAHLSDLHFGAITRGAPEALVEAVRSVRPGLVIVSGDLTLRGSAMEFRAARTFLESLAEPAEGSPPPKILCVPGNHDIPAYQSVRRFFDPFGRYRATVGDLAVDAYEDDAAAVLGLNSARAFGWHWNWSHGRVSAGQIARARRFFAERRGKAFRALVVHHPPLLFEAARSFRPLGRGAGLLAALGETRVHAILTGHLHRPLWVLPEGGEDLVHLHAGTALSSRLRGGVNCFDVLKVAPPEFTIQRWSFEGGAFRAGEVRGMRLSEPAE